MIMKTYQCSQCRLLYYADGHCGCLVGIDPRTNHREKGDAKKCRSNFKVLGMGRQWHEPFAWEN